MNTQGEKVIRINRAGEREREQIEIVTSLNLNANTIYVGTFGSGTFDVGVWYQCESYFVIVTIQCIDYIVKLWEYILPNLI